MKGLLGGTFDPPHIGHLVLASRARNLFGLEEVLLVPSRFPPHKNRLGVTPFHHRMRMTELAANSRCFITAADLEDRSSPSWTVDLLRRLAGTGSEFCFIMGMDSLQELETWKDPHRLSEYARLVAGTRPGYSDGDTGFQSSIETFGIPSLAVSSSDLRRRFAQGLDTRYLVPETIREYVEGNALYG